MAIKDSFDIPPAPYNAEGEWRRVGFELEFSGLTIQQAGDALRSALGGTLAEESVAKSVLHVEDLGDFQLELDWNYLQNKAVEDAAEQKEPSQWIELLSQSAAILVPLEVVCPPIPINQLDRLQPMVTSLRKAGAVGTRDSLIAAYGVHVNAEIPRLDASTLFSFLRAFSLLQWWFFDEHNVDFTRKLSPYIDLYPEGYLKQLFACSHSSMEELIGDYLIHNASRNRALDLLPIFSVIDKERVNRAVGDDKIQGRPAFHFRLPDCHIENPEWSLRNSWNSWLLVEKLAGNGAALEMLGEKFLTLDRPLLGVSRSDWTDLIDQWLRDQSLV